MEFDDMARLVLDDFLALDDIGVLEAYLPARLEAEVLLGRLFHEVLLLDVERARERHEAMAAMHRIVVREQPLLFILGVVRDDDL